MSSGGAVEQIDGAIAAFFASGNVWTVGLAGLLVITLLWPILTGKDPDIHPFLLARQAQASPVRQPGESAVFRANEIPYGYPLRRGLGVKDPGAPAWSAGRDGDLRDVWRRATEGAKDDKGASLGRVGKLLTILGREKVMEQNMGQVTQAINSIGKFIQEKGGETVVVSLSNSIELLATIFASAFYGFKPVLIPTGLDQAQLESLLAKVRADFLIGEVATFDLKSALSVAPSIKNIIWVVKEGSQHMDWTDKPEGVEQINITTWHELVRDRKGSEQVPESEKDSTTGPIATFWKGRNGQYELVEYPSATLVAGVGGLLSTLVRQHKITPDDVLLPTASLTETYTLCWTFAALFSGASIALNSVAGDSVDLTLAAVGASPTIIVSSSGTTIKLHERLATYASGLPQKLTNYFQRRSMQSGYMSSTGSDSISPNLSKLRILLISQRGSDTSKLSSAVLDGLRVALGARIGYALTAAPVAGAVTQTNIFDYRVKGNAVSCGPPVASLELYITGDDTMVDRDLPEGKIMVRGPSVIDGKAQLDISARIDLDRTVTLI